MPHIPSRPPKPDRDDDDDADTVAINQLTKAVIALTAWLKANAGAATKADLDDAKADIIRAIKAGGGVTPGIVAAAERTQVALDRLDAQIPDAK